MKYFIILLFWFIYLISPFASYAGVSEQIIYDDQGNAYRAVINGPGPDGIYVSSMPVLNIIEDTSSKAYPEQIIPGIAVDSISLYPQGSNQPLDWCTAEPILTRSLMLMPNLYEVYPPSEFEEIALNQGIFLIPGTFKNLTLENTLQDIQNYERRVEIYTRVFLDLFSRQDWLREQRSVSAILAGDAAPKSLGKGAGFYLHYLDDERTQAGLQAALSHGQALSKSDVLKKVQARTSFAKTGLKFVTTGLEMVQAVGEVDKTIAILAVAMELEDSAAAHQAVIKLLSVSDPKLDPAMKEGGEKALELWEALATERLTAAGERIKAAAKILVQKGAEELLKEGVRAAVNKFPSIASLSPKLLGAAGGLVVVGMETWDTNQLGLYLGGLITAGRYITSRTENIAGNSSAGLNLAALIRINHYASYLSYLRLNDELFRFAGTNKALTKFVPYKVKSWMNPDLKKSLLNSESQIERVLAWEDQVKEAMPALYKELREKYQGGDCGEQVAQESSLSLDSILEREIWAFDLQIKAYESCEESNAKAIIDITQNYFNSYKTASDLRYGNIENDYLTIRINRKTSDGNTIRYSGEGKNYGVSVELEFGKIDDRTFQVVFICNDKKCEEECRGENCIFYLNRCTLDDHLEITESVNPTDYEMAATRFIRTYHQLLRKSLQNNPHPRDPKTWDKKDMNNILWLMDWDILNKMGRQKKLGERLVEMFPDYPAITSSHSPELFDIDMSAVGTTFLPDLRDRVCTKEFNKQIDIPRKANGPTRQVVRQLNADLKRLPEQCATEEGSPVAVVLYIARYEDRLKGFVVYLNAETKKIVDMDGI